jgi:uncharacterized protein
MINIKMKVSDAMKLAMKNQDKENLSVIRLILSEIKQKEIDDGLRDVGLTDEQITDLLVKMVKKRKDAIIQFNAASRQDLVNKENFEIAIISSFLPQQLPEDQLSKIISDAISFNNAESIKDMAKVMQYLRKSLAGSADLEQVGKMVKDRLLNNANS